LKKMLDVDEFTHAIGARFSDFMRRLHDRTGFGVALVCSKLAARLDDELWGMVPQRQIEEDFPTIHAKEVFAESILRHSVCTRQFVGYDGVDGGLARSAIDKLKRAYIPEASSYARKRLAMLEKQVAAIEQQRDLGKGGGGGGTGGGGGGGSSGGGGSGGGGEKKPVCRQWNGTEGSCSFPNCKFEHWQRSSRPCRDFARKGSCPRGDKCKFSNVAGAGAATEGPN